MPDEIPPGLGRFRPTSPDAFGDESGASVSVFREGQYITYVHSGNYVDLEPGHYSGKFDLFVDEEYEFTITAGSVTGLSSGPLGRLSPSAPNALQEESGASLSIFRGDTYLGYMHSGNSLDMPPGDYRGVFDLFVDEEIAFSISAHAVTSISSSPLGRLTPSAPNALREESGASLSIFRGDTYLGYMHSGRSLDMPPGDYRGVFDLFVDEEVSFSITAHAVTPINSSPLGRLVPRSPNALQEETGASLSIFLGDKYLGYTHSGNSVDMPPGDYRGVFDLFVDEEIAFSISAHTTTSVTSSPLGRLLGSAPNALGEEIGCSVSVFEQDKYLGYFHSGNFVDLPPGKYRTQFDLAIDLVCDCADVAAHQISTVKLHKLGRLKVTTPNANNVEQGLSISVYQSGIYRTYFHAGRYIELPQSKYQLSVRQPSGENLFLEVEVHSGQETKLQIPFNRSGGTEPAAVEGVVWPRPDAFCNCSNPGGTQPTTAADATKVDKIEAKWLEIDKATAFHHEYELPADQSIGENSDKRPRAVLEASAFVKDNGNFKPAPKDTELTVSVSDPFREQGAHPYSLFVNGQELANNLVKTDANGKVKIEIRCSPIATRRKKQASGEIIETQAANYNLKIKPKAGNVEKEATSISIVPGAPKTCEIVQAKDVGLDIARLRAPNGNPFRKAESVGSLNGIAVISVPTSQRISKMELTYGGPLEKKTGSDNSVKAKMVEGGRAYLLLIETRDAFDNPCTMQEGSQENGYWNFMTVDNDWTVGTKPCIWTTDNQFVNPDKALYRAAPRDPTVPVGITVALVVPRYSVTEKNTKLTVSSFAFDDGNGSAIPGANVKITIPAKAPQNIYRWFLEGEVESKSDFLREIAISLVPIVGDGRDILIHGYKLATDKELKTLDHLTAVLAVAGLTLDVANIVTLGGTAPIDATVGGLKATAKLMRSSAAKESVEKFGAVMLETLQNIKTKEGLVKEFKRLEPLGSKLWALRKDPDKLRTLVDLMGMALAVVALKDLLPLLAKYDVDQLMDLLWGASELDKPDEAN